MLKINNLTKSSGRIDAHPKINIDLRQNEFYGSLEPNRAGNQL